MPPKVTDPHEKAIAAGLQLQEALVSASEALKTIAGFMPALFSQGGNAIASDTSISNAPSASRIEASTTAPTSNKRKRKEKDPGAPEKPLTAYHLFASKDKKDQIKQALGADATGNDVIQEINRLWKEMSDAVKKPFNDAAEKLKEKYKKELEGYEQGKDEGSATEPTKTTESAASAKTKSATSKGGFTAVKASPLVVNPHDSDSDDDSQDEAAVAANLGASQPSSSVSPAKRQRRESAKQADSTNAKKEKKEKKEKTKEKEKEKDKDKDKKKRRSKSSKADA